MFDVAPTEFLLVAFVALVVIGPKDLPKAMRVLGYWVGRARAVGRQFRAGFDEMVREAELAEMEKKWKAENERIMREFSGDQQAPALPGPDTTTDQHAHDDAGDQMAPVMVERPHVEPAVSDAEQPSLFGEPAPPENRNDTDAKAPS